MEGEPAPRQPTALGEVIQFTTRNRLDRAARKGAQWDHVIKAVEELGSKNVPKGSNDRLSDLRLSLARSEAKGLSHPGFRARVRRRDDDE